MKLNIKIEWLIIIALVAYIILLQQCGGKGETCPEASVTTKTVTSLIKGTNDTILVEVEKPIYITVAVPSEPEIVTVTLPSGEEVAANEYKTEVKDSLLEGTITSQVDGKLLSQTFEYKPLYPKYITRVDTFREETTNKVIKKRWGISAGAELGASATSLNVSPVVSLHMRNDYIYSYRYGLFDKTHNITIQKRLNFRKKSITKIL